MKKGTIIYDFDGVIVDSKKAVFLFYQQVFKAFGLKEPDWHDPQTAKFIFSASYPEMLDTFCKGCDEKTRWEILQYRPADINGIINATKLEKGVAKVLKELYKDYHLAICTNRGESISAYLERFGISKYFSMVVTAGDVRQAKPDPEGVSLIMNHFGSRKAIFIGDSESDYYAANRGGAKFIAFKNDLHDAVKIMEHDEIYEHLPLLHN